MRCDLRGGACKIAVVPPCRGALQCAVHCDGVYAQNISRSCAQNRRGHRRSRALAAAEATAEPSCSTSSRTTMVVMVTAELCVRAQVRAVPELSCASFELRTVPPSARHAAALARAKFHVCHVVLLSRVGASHKGSSRCRRSVRKWKRKLRKGAAKQLLYWTPAVCSTPCFDGSPV